MPKVIINPIQNLDNPPTAVARMNGNFAAIQAAIEKTLSRDGTVPNAMQSNFDMNANRILNLPVPVSPTEPARHGDIQQYVDQAREWAEYSEEQADRSEEEADASEASAQRSEAALLDLKSRYIGSYPSGPTVDEEGRELLVGALYFNTTLNILYVFALDDIHSNGDAVVVGEDFVVIGYWIPVPAVEFTQLNDVDLDGVQNGDFLIWDGLQVKPVTLEASLMPQNNGVYTGSTVQDALDDLVYRTSLATYDISFWIEGLMENNEVLFKIVASRSFNILNGMSGSQAVSGVPANEDTTFFLLRNGNVFGTVFFAEDSDVGVFTTSADTLFNEGDILTVQAPASADTALRDTALTLVCRR